MSNFCQNCERLQSKPDRTAPERTQFQQPIKYDHYENYQKFKQLKEQDIAKILPQLRCEHHENSDNSRKQQSSNNDIENSEAVSKSLQRHKSLLLSRRTPMQCPISTCRRTIGVTFVLSHYLRDHNEDSGVPCEEIYAGKRSVLKFNPTGLEYSENVCLGILAYGGDVNERSSSPSEKGLWINNAFLPKAYDYLATHLPILIMACQTSWSSLLENGKKAIKTHKPYSMNQELLVLWLASPQTAKPIHCIVTVYDKLMKSSRSSIMQIRDLNDEQSPPDFMKKGINFICLSHGDIKVLSQHRTENIHMEIMINEYL